MAAKKKAPSRKASKKAAATKAIRKSAAFKAEQKALAAETKAQAIFKKIPKRCAAALDTLGSIAEMFHSGPQELTPANYTQHVRNRTSLLEAEIKVANACGCKR